MFVDFTREDASNFLLNYHLYIEQRTVILNFLHHHNFRRDVRTLLFGDSQKRQAQNILLSKAVPTFIRKVGESLKEHNPPAPILLVISDTNVFYIINVYILIIVMLSVRLMLTWYWSELHIRCKTCVQSYCIYMTIKYANNKWDLKLLCPKKVL